MLVGVLIFEKFGETKSRIFAWPPEVTIMLLALMSRWMMFFE